MLEAERARQTALADSTNTSHALERQREVTASLSTENAELNSRIMAIEAELRDMRRAATFGVPSASPTLPPGGLERSAAHSRASSGVSRDSLSQPLKQVRRSAVTILIVDLIELHGCRL